MADLPTLAAMKLHLRVTSESEDVLIQEAMDAAITHIERETNLVLSPRTVIEEVADGGILTPRLRTWPISAVTSVSYRDIAGNVALVEAPAYYSILARRPGRMGLITPWAPPVTVSGRGTILVAMEAGFAAGDVPANIVQAVKLVTAEFYKNREAGGLSEEAQRAISWILRTSKVKTL